MKQPPLKLKSAFMDHVSDMAKAKNSASGDASELQSAASASHQPGAVPLEVSACRKSKDITQKYKEVGQY